MSDLATKIVEDGGLVEPDYEAQELIVRDSIQKERQQAKAAGLELTPWRRRLEGEHPVRWCSFIDYHQKSHRKKEMGVYFSYSVVHPMMIQICERCFRKFGTHSKKQILNGRWYNIRWLE